MLLSRPALLHKSKNTSSWNPAVQIYSFHQGRSTGWDTNMGRREQLYVVGKHRRTDVRRPASRRQFLYNRDTNTYIFRHEILKTCRNLGPIRGLEQAPAMFASPQTPLHFATNHCLKIHLNIILSNNFYLQDFVTLCVEKKNQLDVTECFIVLMICSTCFGHFYAHHQEL